MFHYLESVLFGLSETIPLEWFVLVASIVEEIVAPIPSPTVMMLAGSFASLQGYSFYGLVTLVCIGAIGKMFGAMFVYGISYYAEDIVINRFGNFFGVTQESVQQFGNKITENGFRGYVLLTLFRALPIVPSVIVSVGSGVCRVPFPMFVISTFLGTLVRDGLYLYAGYIGTDALHALVKGTARAETVVEYVCITVIIAMFVYIIYTRRHSQK